MKYKFFVFLVLFSLFVPTKANAQQPYPDPELPNGLTGIVFPPANPRDGVAYCWGLLGKIYTSISPAPLVTDARGVTCIREIEAGEPALCYELGFEGYSEQTQTLLYSANYEPRLCDKWWAVVYSFFIDHFADIREPNEYYIQCTFLPFNIQAVLDWFMMPGF